VNLCRGALIAGFLLAVWQMLLTLHDHE
jgi:hypothetical protein